LLCAGSPPRARAHHLPGTVPAGERLAAARTLVRATLSAAPPWRAHVLAVYRGAARPGDDLALTVEGDAERRLAAAAGAEVVLPLTDRGTIVGPTSPPLRVEPSQRAEVDGFIDELATSPGPAWTRALRSDVPWLWRGAVSWLAGRAGVASDAAAFLGDPAVPPRRRAAAVPHLARGLSWATLGTLVEDTAHRTDPREAPVRDALATALADLAAPLPPDHDDRRAALARLRAAMAAGSLAAATGLARLGDATARPVLAAVLARPAAATQRRAAEGLRALAAAGDRAAWDLLEGALRANRLDRRTAAAVTPLPPRPARHWPLYIPLAAAAAAAVAVAAWPARRRAGTRRSNATPL
jgi:hypothetical protein